MANEKKQQNGCCSSVMRKTSIGGQALIEGIMMRGPKKTAMAVRDPKGEIVFEEWENQSKKRSKITKLPIIRGVFGFIDSMTTGYKALMRSAELSGLEEAEAELAREKAEKKAAKAAKKAAKKGAKQAQENESVPQKSPAEAPETENVADASAFEKAKSDTGEKKGTSPLMVGIMVLSVVIATVIMVTLFIWFPTFVYGLLANAFPKVFRPENPVLLSLAKSAFEGIFKVVLLVGYMALTSLMKDIRRTFQYHGAEHKTIFCYEHGKALTVENVRGERRFHPRCGTSFLVLMVLVSIFVCFFIDPVLIGVTGVESVEDFGPKYMIIRTAIRLLLLPLIMGLGYEVLKLAGKYENAFTRIISAPGMWLQRITVREPDDSMIECAIKAFIAVIPEAEIEEEMAKIAAETPEAPAFGEDGNTAPSADLKASEETPAEE